MVLGGNTLFPRDGLYNEDGTLKERWQQDGSALINLSFDNNSDRTIYTVTAGKILYVTSVFVTVTGVAGDGWLLRDNGIGGTTRLQATNSTTKGTNYQITCNPPLKFETDVYNVESGTCNSHVSLTGWEENA